MAGNGKKNGRTADNDDVQDGLNFGREQSWTQVSITIAQEQDSLENSRQVFQTAGAPPKVGRIIFAAIGSARKSRLELRNAATRNKKRTCGQIVACTCSLLND